MTGQLRKFLTVLCIFLMMIYARIYARIWCFVTSNSQLMWVWTEVIPCNNKNFIKMKISTSTLKFACIQLFASQLHKHFNKITKATDRFLFDWNTGITCRSNDTSSLKLSPRIRLRRISYSCCIQHSVEPGVIQRLFKIISSGINEARFRVNNLFSSPPGICSSSG